MAKTIGQLIEEEVRKQQWVISAFADRICCTRNNVYDIFQRSKMDVAQLELISKVLGRNFFKDLADNPELADANNPEVEKDLQRRRAIAQFFEVMPKVILDLNIDTNIVMPIMKNEHNDPLPDYGLSDYAIFFTVGDRLLDRCNNDHIGLFDIRTEKTTEGQPFDIWRYKLNNSQFVNIKLDYKTEDEWREYMIFLKDKPYAQMLYPSTLISRL